MFAANAVGRSRAIVRSIVTTSYCGTKGNIARICMASPPVNSLDLTLIKDIKAAVEEAENSKACKGIIIASSSRAFCAGLHLQELFAKTPAELINFWNNFQNMLFTIYSSKKVVVAEINGPSPAGGAMISYCSDARVMVDSAKIGLNEAAFGLVPPYFAVDMMEDIIGRGETYRACSLGVLYTAEEAGRLKLVDRVCKPEELSHAAISEAELWMKAPGRSHTKQLMREERLERWNKRNAAESLAFAERVNDPHTQQFIRTYLESLSSKRK